MPYRTPGVPSSSPFREEREEREELRLGLNVTRTRERLVIVEGVNQMLVSIPIHSTLEHDELARDLVWRALCRALRR